MAEGQGTRTSPRTRKVGQQKSLLSVLYVQRYLAKQKDVTSIPTYVHACLAEETGVGLVPM